MIKSILLFFLIFSIQIFCTSKEIIKSRIENVLQQIPANTIVGMLVYNPLTQDTIFEINHTRSMIPASNTKLFTTSAALSLMGGDFPLKTILSTPDKNLDDGIINGNLYIKGYGNSTFTEEDLDTMVIELKEKGIGKITGNIIGDDSYFDEIYSRDDWIDDEVANVRLPPISALVIDRNTKVFYRKRRGHMRRYIAYYNNPPLHAAILLKQKLKSRGIIVEGGSIKGEAPIESQIIIESNILLRDLVKRINKHSDNFLAECLFKTIGAFASGKQGNSFYSTQAILGFIDDNGIYSKGTAIVDGSGISRFNQVTTGAIIGLLQKMYFDLINFEDFYNSLSIAGVDGTLEDRMENSYARNNFHGKTGTLNGVSSLSGFLTTKGNDDLIVSIFFDYDKGSRRYYRDIEDQIIDILSDWN